MGANSSAVHLDNIHLWRKQNTKITSANPVFTEIFDDANSSDTSGNYQIQLIKKGGTFSSPLWDSGKTSMSSTAEGARTASTTYGGSALEQGEAYYWRVKLWDNSDAAGPWSNGRDFFNKAGKKLQDLTYTYDANGNVTQLVDNSGTATKKTVAYGYDDLNRMVSASSTGVASGLNYSQTFSYDAIGNITNKSDVGAYAYSATGKTNPHAVTSAGSLSFTYDDNGNQLTGNALANTWNYKNRLTQTVATSTYLQSHECHQNDMLKPLQTASL